MKTILRLIPSPRAVLPAVVVAGAALIVIGIGLFSFPYSLIVLGLILVCSAFFVAMMLGDDL